MKTELNNDLDWTTRDSASYVACCYGDQGDEPGVVEVNLQSAVEYPEQDSDDEEKVWWRIYEPESSERDGMWDDEDEARAALDEWCCSNDETPDEDELIQQIRNTGYFEDADIIPLIVSELTRHSQGYLLITPDISQPVGTRWTTNGYLQCAHIRVDATHDNKAIAADSLLRAILASKEEER